MTYDGTIVFIGKTKQVSDKFALREFVVTDTNEKYPQEIKFQVTQKNCPLLDGYNVGDVVSIAYNLRGRRYEKNGDTNWFNAIEAWKIDRKSASPSGPRDYSNAFDDVPF